MKKSKLIGFGVGVLMVGGSLGLVASQTGAQDGVNVAYAQGVPTATPTAPSTQPPAQPSAQGTPNTMLDAFWTALASKLGIGVDDLKTKIVDAQKDAIEQAVTAGTLTRAQADGLEQRLSASNGVGPFPGGFGGGPRGGFRGGPPGGQNGAPNGNQNQAPNGPQNGGQNQAPNGGLNSGPGMGFGLRGGPFGGVNTLEAVATALNLKPADLVAQLQGGKTIADVATAQGVDQAKVKQAIVDAAKAQLQREVDDGLITQAQADQFLTNLTVDQIDLTHIDGFGGMGRPQR